MDETRLYTTEQGARWLRVSPYSLRRALVHGAAIPLIPDARAAKVPLFRPSTLREWAERRRWKARWLGGLWWIPSASAARVLGISREAVRQRIARGGLRWRREGGTVLVAMEDINKAKLLSCE